MGPSLVGEKKQVCGMWWWKSGGTQERTGMGKGESKDEGGWGLNPPPPKLAPLLFRAGHAGEYRGVGGHVPVRVEAQQLGPRPAPHLSLAGEAAG